MPRRSDGDAAGRGCFMRISAAICYPAAGRRQVIQTRHVSADVDKDISPFPSDPSWGQRLSRLVSEQTRLGASSYPIACTTVLAEGFSKGADACAGLPTRRLTAAETAIAETGRMEMSIFGVPRE